MLLLHFKPGTEVTLLDTNLLPGLLSLCHFMETILGITEGTVTSVNDGVHKVGSLHYVGRAIDIRSKIYPPALVSQVVQAFKKLYNTTEHPYDLIWENPGQPGEHLHLEYDPGNKNHE